MRKFYLAILTLVGVAATNVALSQTNAVTLTPPTGPSANYTSITAAYAAIPASPTGNYLIELNANYDGSAETYPISLGDKGLSGGSPTITIRPAAGNNGETIQRTTPAAGAVILLDGGDNIIIDGRPGGVTSTASDYLTVNDPFSGDNTSRDVELINGANNNIIRYIKAVAAAATASAGSRVLNISTSPAGQPNTNNTITNNIVVGGLRGIQVFGTVANNTGNILSNNVVTNFGSIGIFGGSFQDNTTIQSNTVTFNSYNSIGTSLTGIQNQGTGTGLIDGNIINGLTSTVTTQIIGIYLTQSAAATITVRKNKVYDISSSATANIWGMYFSGFTGSTYNVENNFVALTQPNSSVNSVNGIQFAGTAATNVYTSNVYYNSVRIGGTHTGGTAANIVSVGIIRSNNQAGSVYNQKNNIAINERTGGTAGVFHVGFYANSTGTLSVDYNTYFATDATGGMAAGWGSSVYASTAGGLTAYKAAATPNEQNTNFASVTFVSNTDLHLASPSDRDPALKGTPIAGITTDIDGQTRSATTPRQGADDSNLAFPVAISSFTGENKGTFNQLRWTTASENNNAGFELQRSTDGKDFAKLSFINSKGDNGNSTTALSYSFDDTKPFNQNSYYRLKQIDKDGKATYSDVVLIKGKGITKLEISNLYPNPVINEMKVVIAATQESKLVIDILDLSGKNMLQQVNSVKAGDNILTFNVKSLSAGTYILTIRNQATGEILSSIFVK